MRISTPTTGKPEARPSRPARRGTAPRPVCLAVLSLLLAAALPFSPQVSAQTASAGNAEPAVAETAGPGLLSSLDQHLALSGFGTLGFAQSDQDFSYQRFITQRGGFKRDSLLGLQADFRLNTQWSATLQLKAAPALDSDRHWSLTPTWAFVAWRPSDDWLLRAGRMRLPLYLLSESVDVGQTHDMARLPTEIYATAPSNDFDGIDITRTFYFGEAAEREISATLYHGTASTTGRFWARDGLPPTVAAGAAFRDVKVKATGLALVLRQPNLMLRGSVHRTSTRQTEGGGVPVTFPYVPLGPGLGYYQTSSSLPGPGVPQVTAIANTVYSLGAEWQLGGGWRIAGEVMRNRQYDTEFAADTHGNYVALFRRMDKLTPYLSLSRLDSRQSALNWYDTLTKNLLPAYIPGASQLNAAQRLAAESIWVADQRSLAVGASYALSPELKLKGEWLHSRIGRMSRMVDTPVGSETPHDTTVNVLSVNLNFVF